MLPSSGASAARAFRCHISSGRCGNRDGSGPSAALSAGELNPCLGVEAGMPARHAASAGNLVQVRSGCAVWRVFA